MKNLALIIKYTGVHGRLNFPLDSILMHVNSEVPFQPMRPDSPMHPTHIIYSDEQLLCLKKT